MAINLEGNKVISIWLALGSWNTICQRIVDPVAILMSLSLFFTIIPRTVLHEDQYNKVKKINNEGKGMEMYINNFHL